MKWHVYMLRLTNGTIYVGSTNDLNRRWAEHTAGRGSFSCKKSKPAEVIYSETHPDRISAVRRERQLKKWSRAKKVGAGQCRHGQTAPASTITRTQLIRYWADLTDAN